ncbi:MAG: hypothetical protein Q7K42_02985, partial [Candidatus Diapherotrites archaeon]|nr:hypothetical protein [Candidatus Diapherotrites archaeon]
EIPNPYYNGQQRALVYFGWAHKNFMELLGQTERENSNQVSLGRKVISGKLIQKYENLNQLPTDLEAAQFIIESIVDTHLMKMINSGDPRLQELYRAVEQQIEGMNWEKALEINKLIKGKHNIEHQSIILDYFGVKNTISENEIIIH